MATKPPVKEPDKQQPVPEPSREQITESFYRLDIWDIVEGLLAFCDCKKPVGGERVTRYFAALAEDFPQVKSKVVLANNGLRAVSDIEAGLDCRLRQIAPAPNYDRPYPIDKNAQLMLATKLKDRRVLPAYEPVLRWLAQRFDAV